MAQDPYDFRAVEQWLAIFGEHLLMRYSHPGEWINGYELALPHLQYYKVLPVWEIRTFDEDDKRAAKADLCAQAIEAWLRTQDPKAAVFQLYRPNSQTGYLTVTMANWGLALHYLRPLDRKRRERDEARIGAAQG